jgi:hypothetical protein
MHRARQAGGLVLGDAKIGANVATSLSISIFHVIYFRNRRHEEEFQPCDHGDER